MFFAPKWAREPERGAFGYPRDVLILIARPMGWPVVVDRFNRSTDVHWLTGTRAWQRSYGHYDTGDAVIIAGPAIWGLRRPAMDYLCRQCADAALIPPPAAHAAWAALMFRIMGEARRAQTPVSELVLAADEAARAAAQAGSGDQ